MKSMRASLLFLVCGAVFLAQPSHASVQGTAGFTYFESWPRCCKKSPNYDPHAPKDECDDYEGCRYMGKFEATGDHRMELSEVKKKDIVSFYDAEHPHDNCDNENPYWESHYKMKRIKLTKGSVSFEATIYDTCCDGNCEADGGCCTRNKKGRYLVDVEYYTVSTWHCASFHHLFSSVVIAVLLLSLKLLSSASVQALRHFGDLDEVKGTIHFEILESSSEEL